MRAQVPGVGDPRSGAAMLSCPNCGGPCAEGIRACPHCRVELTSVRCGACFALHFAGAQFCAHCGAELQLEATLEPSQSSCPRCAATLSGSSEAAEAGGLASGRSFYECQACGGVFLSQKTLDAVIRRETAKAHSPTHPAGPTSRVAGDAGPVRYLSCPACHTLMNRLNFGRRSGVIVDVCKAHGVWFDKGELPRAVAFVASGGLAESERRDLEEKRRLASEARVLSADRDHPRVSDEFAGGVGGGVGLIADVFRHLFE